ncbi:SDR family oxidoreductase [Rhizobium sp. LjRoot254]|uniref:SDR family oxidoreductase n=1 Tax=Rhizobium sp. LjRoot254 TaxID=3342297 RepID=UPI003ECC3AF9
MAHPEKGGAIVTGAARGIGRAIAAALAEDGFGVLIADMDAATGEKTVAELNEKHPGKFVFAKVNVTKRAEIAAAIAECQKAFGSINVMINNAGFNKPEPFLDITEETWRNIIEVNSLGVLIGIQEAAKAMIAAGTKGKIINTASIAGRTGFADFAPYSASKAAVISLTQAAARALAAKGITVNAFGPGVVDTPLWEKLDDDLYKMGASSKPGEAMSSMASQILLGRVAQPSDVVGTVRFLWSEGSDYMTGQTVIIDGGMVLQ